MAFARTQFNLLLLEENEVYLIDRDDTIVRVFKPDQPAKLLRWMNEKIPIDQEELPSLVKTACLAPALEKPIESSIRLCSKSIILDRPGREVIKIPFNRIRGLWLLTPDIAVRRPSAVDLFAPVSQTFRAPRLVIITDAIVRVSSCLVAGRTRFVCPYTTDVGTWIAELRVTPLTSMPKPLPDWFESEIDVLVKHKKLLNAPDPLFFLHLINKLINLFLENFPNRRPPRLPTKHSADLPLLPSHSHPSSTSSLQSNSSLPALTFHDAITLIESFVPSVESFPFVNLDHRESQLLSITVKRQLPLHTCRGVLAVTDAAIYFQPFPISEKAGLVRLPWTDIRAAILRIVDLRPTTVALLHASGSTTPLGHGLGNGELAEAKKLSRAELNTGPPDIGELNLIFDSEVERSKFMDIVKLLRPDALVARKGREFLKVSIYT